MQTKDMTTITLGTVSDVKMEISDNLNDEFQEDEMKHRIDNKIEFYPPHEKDQNSQNPKISSQNSGLIYKNFSSRINDVDNQEKSQRQTKTNKTLTININDNEHYQDEEEELSRLKTSKNLLKEKEKDLVAYGNSRSEDTSRSSENISRVVGQDSNNITDKRLISHPTIDYEISHQGAKISNDIEGNQGKPRNSVLNSHKFFKQHKKAIIISCGIFIALITAILFGILLPQLLAQHSSNDGTDKNDSTNPLITNLKLGKFITINATQQYLLVKYPITKEDYLASVRNSSLKTMPLQFDLNEECNYTINFSFFVESDALQNQTINGKDQEVSYDVSFYTTNIQKDNFTIVLKYQPSRAAPNGQQGWIETYQPINQTNAEWVKREQQYFKNQTSSSQQNVSFDNLKTNEEIRKYLSLSMKVAKCDIAFNGTLIKCAFIANMTYDDQILAIKLLRMYIPTSLDLSLYQQTITPTNNGYKIYDKETSGTIERAFGGISHQYRKENQNEYSGIYSKTVDDYDHVLDINTGKISKSTKYENIRYYPNQQLLLDSYQRVIKQIQSESSAEAELISMKLLTQAEMTSKLNEFDDFEYITMQSPQETLYQNSIKLNDITPAGEGDSWQIPGRSLVSSFNSVSDGWKRNFIFATQDSSVYFDCETDDSCKLSMYTGVQEQPSWRFQIDINANMNITQQQVRYIKLVFQNNIQLMKSLTTTFQSQIDIAISENFKALNSELKKFQQPIYNAEQLIQSYTIDVLRNVVSIKQETLDIATSVDDVLNHFINQRINQLQGSVYSEINIVAVGFQEILTDYKALVTTAGKKYSNTSVGILKNQKTQALQTFDKVCANFDANWTTFMTKNLDLFVQAGARITNISQSQSFGSDFAPYINIVIKMVTDKFYQLYIQYSNSLTNMRDGLKVQVLLYHASQRLSIQEKFDQIIRYVSESESGNDPLPLLDISLFSTQVSQVNINYEPLKITDDMLISVMSEMETRITRDQFYTFSTLYSIQKGDHTTQKLNDIYAVFNQSVQSLNQSISDSLALTALNITSTFQKAVTNITLSLQNIPTTLDQQFNDTVALSNPYKKMDMNREILNIKALISDLNTTMVNFYSLVNVNTNLNAQISSTQTYFNSITPTSRLVALFNEITSQLQFFDNQFRPIVFKKPDNPFQNTTTYLKGFEKALENQVLAQGIQGVSDKVKDTGSQYGSTFLYGLQSKLDARVLQLIPYTKKTLVKNITQGKRIQFATIPLRLAFGSVKASIDTQVSTNVKIYFDYNSGNYTMTADAQMKTEAFDRMIWNFGNYQLGTSAYDLLYDGNFVTNKGVSLDTAYPMAFYSSVSSSAALTRQLALFKQDADTVFIRQCYNNKLGQTRCNWYPRQDWGNWENLNSQQSTVMNSFSKTLQVPTWKTIRLT